MPKRRGWKWLATHRQQRKALAWWVEQEAKARQMLDFWRNRAASAEEAIDAAINELGVPQPGYPAPVANAARILRLHGGSAEDIAQSERRLVQSEKGSK